MRSAQSGWNDYEASIEDNLEESFEGGAGCTESFYKYGFENSDDEEDVQRRKKWYKELSVELLFDVTFCVMCLTFAIL